MRRATCGSSWIAFLLLKVFGFESRGNWLASDRWLKGMCGNAFSGFAVGAVLASALPAMEVRSVDEAKDVD